MFYNSTYQLGGLPATEGNGIVSLVPRTEWCSVDGNDASLHECLGTHQLVVAGIVDHIDDSGLAGHSYNRDKTCNIFM